jgi:hypothetical protein
MGSMSSPSKIIEQINFRPFPTRPESGLKVVRFDDHLFAVGAKGSVYTTLGIRKNIHICGRWSWSATIIEALDLLGLLTDADKKAHQDYLAAEKEGEEKVQQLGTLVMACGVPGSGVSMKRVLSRWNALDWYCQCRAEKRGYRPKGSQMKPRPGG